MSKTMHPFRVSGRASETMRGGERDLGIMAALTLGLVGSLAGCTAILDTSKSQCEVEQDCINLFPGSTYQCVQNVCEQPFCEQDQTCRDLGERFATSICDIRIHQCVQGECSTLDGCGSGRVCNLATNRCVERECQSRLECLTPVKESPTVQCVDGFCVDPTWSCIGQPDNRERVAGAKGTLEIPLLSVTTNQPIPGALWRAVICGSTPGCVSVAGAGSWSYDATTGIMRVTGLDPELPVRIWLDETAIPDATGSAPVPAEGGAPRSIIPIEFVTQKPAIGVTKTAPVQVVAWSEVAAFRALYTNGPAGDAVDLTNLIDKSGEKANIFGVAYDCEDKPASNVQLSFRILSMGEVTDHSFFFFNEQKQALSSLSAGGAAPHFWTFSNGLVTTLGLPSAVNLNVRSQLVVDDRMATRTRVIRDNFVSRLTSGRMTTLHFYPRDYSKKTK